MEMAAVLKLDKPLIFSCGEVAVDGSGWRKGRGRVGVVRGDEAHRFLSNCRLLVDVERAQCAVPADKERELATIGPANFKEINRVVGSAVSAGSTVVEMHVSEVDAFNCGEPGPLQVLAKARVWRAFKVACSAGQLAVLKELRRTRTEEVAAYLAGDGGDGDGGWEPVWTAAIDGQHEVVEWLVGEVGAAAGSTNLKNDETSAIFVAAENGHLKVVQVLTKARADMDKARKVDGQTPLIAAVSYGYNEVAQCLIEAGARMDKGDDDGDVPLILASQEGRTDAVVMLVEAGAKVNQANDKGATALIMAADEGHLDVATVLIEAGASVDQADEDGQTPLIGSAGSGHMEVVKRLMEAGASLDQGDSEESTALIMAAEGGHLEVVTLLVKAGASVNHADNDGFTPLISCALDGHLKVVSTLVEAGARVGVGEGEGEGDGGAALLVAAQDSHLKVLACLVNAGVDLDQARDNGHTALHKAAHGGRLDVAQGIFFHIYFFTFCCSPAFCHAIDVPVV